VLEPEFLKILMEREETKLILITACSDFTKCELMEILTSTTYKRNLVLRVDISKALYKSEFDAYKISSRLILNLYKRKNLKIFLGHEENVDLELMESEILWKYLYNLIFELQLLNFFESTEENIPIVENRNLLLRKLVEWLSKMANESAYFVPEKYVEYGTIRKNCFQVNKYQFRGNFLEDGSFIPEAYCQNNINLSFFKQSPRSVFDEIIFFHKHPNESVATLSDTCLVLQNGKELERCQQSDSEKVKQLEKDYKGNTFLYFGKTNAVCFTVLEFSPKTSQLYSRIFYISIPPIPSISSFPERFIFDSGADCSWISAELYGKIVEMIMDNEILFEHLFEERNFNFVIGSCNKVQYIWLTLHYGVDTKDHKFYVGNMNILGLDIISNYLSVFQDQKIKTFQGDYSICISPNSNIPMSIG